MAQTTWLAVRSISGELAVWDMLVFGPTKENAIQQGVTVDD
jgi:hypothetical protein